LLAGFLEIANRAMAEAIRAVSIGQGHDVRTHALFVLGGAGGQHACQVARLLGIETIVFHPFGGVLAALGLGLADVGWHATRELILPLTEAALATAKRELEALSALGSKQLMEQVGTGHELEIHRTLALRYAGTETAIPCPLEPLADLRRTFHRRHRELFGHARPEHAIDLVNVTAEAYARRAFPDLHLPAGESLTRRTTRLFSDGGWLDEVPVLDRSLISPADTLAGPIVIVDATGTIVIEPGFSATIDGEGTIVATDERTRAAIALVDSDDAERADPVLLEVMGRRFMSIAEQMGRVLGRTAWPSALLASRWMCSNRTTAGRRPSPSSREWLRKTVPWVGEVRTGSAWTRVPARSMSSAVRRPNPCS
jgi:5-oxoprolinase (ATP-hydrolysing)